MWLIVVLFPLSVDGVIINTKEVVKHSSVVNSMLVYVGIKNE